MTKFDSDADKWLARYEIAVDNQQPMFKKFSKWFDLMYASLSTKDYAPWRSKVYLPILASKAWNILAKLQALNPGFEVGLYDEAEDDQGSEDKAKKAQWKLEHDWNNPDFDEPITDKLFSPLVDALVTGTGMAKLPWCTKDKATYTRPSLEAGYTDLSKQEKTTQTIGYNELEPVNIFNVFMAPGATNLYGAEWVIIKEFKTWDALKNEGKYDSKTLDNLKGSRADSDQFAAEKKSRNRMTNDQDPITSDETLDMVEIFECYEKSSGKICTYASGGSKRGETTWLELKSQKNVYWHGKYPLVVFYVRKRPYDFWGQGLFEDTERMQMAVIDVFNHFVDSYNLSVNGMIQKQQGEEFKYVVRPGGELTYRQNPAQQFKFADPNPTVFSQVATMIEGAIEEATISQYATGTPDSATDKTSGTASGIRSLQSAAGDKIAYMKANYRTSLRNVGTQWLSNNQQFLSRPVTVDGQVDNKPAPVKVTPQDLQGNMVLKINDASMEPVGQQDQLQQWMAYKDATLQLQQASIMQAQLTGGTTKPLFLNFQEMFQNLSNKFSQNNYQQMIDTEAQYQPPQQPQQQEKPQPQQKQVSESLSYKDATPMIKAQIEQQAGLQPDPIHAVEAHTALSQNLSDQVNNVAGASNQVHGATTDQQPVGAGANGRTP